MFSWQRVIVLYNNKSSEGDESLMRVMREVTKIITTVVMVCSFGESTHLRVMPPKTRGVYSILHSIPPPLFMVHFSRTHSPALAMVDL